MVKPLVTAASTLASAFLPLSLCRCPTGKDDFSTGIDPPPSLGNMATEFHNLQDLRHTATLATKVFIQRDYRDGTVCKFQTKFPEELDNRIERALFEDTIKTLNNYYAEAEKISGQSYLEGCLACASAYIIFLCMETRYEKVLRKISMYIQEQNEKIYAPRGLLITDPVERGMRVIEISIFDDRISSGSSSSGSSVSSGSAR
ncbi:golgin subfamily A member 7B [Electrophorus electricus]|uniref:golgin subfamily A member 7B n=1 Tax=Electrophorus electricus TaxID=8005 RepID=UPI0015D0BD0E|nr:golgin subfamily A member 7B [Electrophorus electricus]